MGFFKAYDMRGTFGTDFDLGLVRRIGRTLPDVVGGTRWLVGRDARASSPAVRDALVAGFADAGVSVTDIGLATTPMVYFFTAEDGYDGSVMITASHNPPGDNGLKVSKRTALPVGYADGLDRVERLVIAGDAAKCFSRDADRSSRLRDDADRSSRLRDDADRSSRLRERYLDWQRARMRGLGIGDLRLAVDCSNGTASLLAHELFPNAVFLNDVLDGTFPGHSPNPLKPEAREQIAALVREKGLDAGVIFDGDADRAMFVDETGAFVQPDYLIPVVARATRRALGAAGAEPVVHDVRTSRGAIETLREDGFEPVMVPVGHAFAKPILRQRGALCGGELAGHYYFREFHGCDSGVLSATRILGEVAAAKARGETFSRMMRPIVSRYANSGELNFRVADKDAAIARVLDVAARELPRETGRETMDGIRIEYAEGWINVRKSNTEPYLRLIAECDTASRLAGWLGVLTPAMA